MKVQIWNYLRKPKTVEGKKGQDFALTLTSQTKIGHGAISENNNANLETIRENGGRVIEKNGIVYVAFNHFEEFEEDISSL